MRTNQILKQFSLLCAILIATHGLSAQDGKTIHGFKLVEKRFVKEVNSVCSYYQHVASGAKVLKIENADQNKTFSVTFHTIPQNDCGTAHILEHSVLNGSKNFPVKSPFDIVSKGSLNTFINALTYKDRTTYPLASMNEKDYFNLMQIYLDAVFNPLLYDEPRIFKQEGWHHDLASADADMEFKGVVYGEMKGSFSNPARYVSLYTYRYLFPDVAYGFESGGYPPAIPDLTWKDFTNFHKTYYHPENSFIVFYGDADINKELEFLDKNYLSKYKKSGAKIEIGVQKPMVKMVRKEEFYPVRQGTPTEGQTYLTLSFVNNYGKDMVKSQALSLLAYYLFNREAAPVRLALQEAGIGKNSGAGSTDYKQNVFTIQAQKANANELDKFYELVMNTLKDIVAKGINKDELESVLNIFEFQNLEDNNAQKGITYLENLMPQFIYNNDPFIGLEYEATMKSLRDALKTDYFEKLIQSALINNPHALLLSVAPKVGLDKEISDAEKQRLANYKKGLSQDEIQKLVAETADLVAFQQSEDSPEGLASIPVLSLSDINPKANFNSAEVKKADKITMLHRTEHTNNIVYLNLYFDLRVLDQDQIQYASLLSNLLGSLNTQNYSFGEMDLEINRNIGGFDTYLNRFLVSNDDNNMVPVFVVSSKATMAKLDELMKINNEILNNSKFEDKERIKELLVRHLSSLEAQFSREGSQVAASRYASYISKSGLFNELTGGYEYYKFIENLVKNFDEKGPEIMATINKVAKKLFVKDFMTMATTCSKENYEKLIIKLVDLTVKFEIAKAKLNIWDLKPESKNEGILSSSKVQYVFIGYNYKKLGYEYSGKMLVMNKVLSSNYLNQYIRVMGGAYGGYSQISSSGYFTMASYRDPNLGKTVEDYKKAPEFLKEFTTDDKEMTQFIIGTISDLDQPLSPSERGNDAFRNYFCKLDQAYYQQVRNQVLTTTAADIQSYSTMIADIIAKNTLCAYGNADAVEAEKALFKALLQMK